MGNTFHILLPALSLAAVLSACSREMVMDTMEEPRVVVECVLSDRSVQTLGLYYTKGASMDEAPVLREAEASLTDLTTGEDAGNFVRQDDGTWTLDYSAVPLHSYRLEVRVPGHELIWAEQTMPYKCEAVSVHGPLSGRSTSSGVHPTGCMIHIMPNGFHVDGTPQWVRIWVRALNYNPDTGKREPAEYICSDAPNIDNFNITGETYDPPTSTIRFAGQECTGYLYPELIGRPLHRRYLRLNVYPESDRASFSIIISGSFTDPYYDYALLLGQEEREPEDDEGIVLINFVSDDYDLYLRDATYFQMLTETSDMSSVSVRDNMFTNINGGLGIFGAMTETYTGWYPTYFPFFED